MGGCASINNGKPRLYSKWKWTKKELMETFLQGLPELQQWSSVDKSINSLIKKDRTRTNMKIGAYKGYFIPPVDHEIWSSMGLKGRSKICVILCCTQILWGSIIHRFYNNEVDDIVNGIDCPDPAEYGLVQDSTLERRIHASDGNLYSMMNFNCMNYNDIDNHEHFKLTILVKVSWSVILGGLRGVSVYVFYNDDNSPEIWEKRIDICSEL